MQKYHNVVQDRAGNVINTATITVYDAGTLNVSSLFDDDEVTPLNNPFTSADANYDADGSFWFKAANGDYDIKVVAGTGENTIEDVTLFDEDDFAGGASYDTAGTFDNSVLVWDNTAQQWVEYNNLELTYSGGVKFTQVNGLASDNVTFETAGFLGGIRFQSGLSDQFTFKPYAGTITLSSTNALNLDIDAGANAEAIRFMLNGYTLAQFSEDMVASDTITIATNTAGLYGITNFVHSLLGELHLSDVVNKLILTGTTIFTDGADITLGQSSTLPICTFSRDAFQPPVGVFPDLGNAGGYFGDIAYNGTLKNFSTTNSLSFQTYIADSAGRFAFDFDTINAISAGKLLRLQNNSVSVFEMDGDANILHTSTGGMTVETAVANGASARGLTVKTTNALTNTSALHFAIDNAGTERFGINCGGGLGGSSISIGAVTTGGGFDGMVFKSPGYYGLIGFTYAGGGTDTLGFSPGTNSITTSNTSLLNFSIASGAYGVAVFDYGNTRWYCPTAVFDLGYNTYPFGNLVLDDGTANNGIKWENASRIYQNNDNTLYIEGDTPDDATALGVVLNNQISLTTAGGKLVSVRNAGVEKAYFSKDGGLKSNSNSAIGGLVSISDNYVLSVGQTVNLSAGSDLASINASINTTGSITTGSKPISGASVAVTNNATASGTGFLEVYGMNMTAITTAAMGVGGQIIGGFFQTGNLFGSVETQIAGRFKIGSGGASSVKSIGCLIENGGHASTPLLFGLQVEKQTTATVCHGIFLNGDGVGADIIFGAGRDAGIHYDGTDLVIDAQKVGTGAVAVQGYVTQTKGFIHVQPTTVQNVGGTTGTETAIDWDTTPLSVDTDVFTHSSSTNPSRIEVEKTGRYSVLAKVMTDNTGSNRVVEELFVRVNGTTDIDRSRVTSYSRGAGYDDGVSMLVMTELELTANDYIEIINLNQDAEQTSAVNTVVAKCELIMRRIG